MRRMISVVNKQLFKITTIPPDWKIAVVNDATRTVTKVEPQLCALTKEIISHMKRCQPKVVRTCVLAVRAKTPQRVNQETYIWPARREECAGVCCCKPAQ
ncbi:unnamed protein product [Somion occarium]|uniref:Uncharacterized protein n=1 Tax=Somion occarium TaxID=3059160 RepID=A0ABP1DQQ8_9APHY